MTPSAFPWMKSKATTALEYGKRRAEIAMDNLETKLVDATIDFAYGEEKDWQSIEASIVYAGANFSLRALVFGGVAQLSPDVPKAVLGCALWSGGDMDFFLLTDIGEVLKSSIEHATNSF